MNPKSIVFLVVLVFAIILLIINIQKIISYIRLGQPDNRKLSTAERIKHTLNVAFAQSKILRDKAAGPLHAGIFWGFLILLFSAAEAVFQGLFNDFSFSFLGYLYTLITFATDLFVVAIIVSVLLSYYRRFVIKVERLQGDKKETQDAVIVLTAILIICTSLLLENAASITLGTLPLNAYHPVGALISYLLPDASAYYLYEICWWLHILTIFAFANYLPFSKHFHVYTSIINVYFSPSAPSNKLQPIDFEKEGVEKFGVVDFQDFSWKTLLDSYSCTHCGRCTSVCPANLTGKELSPREIIVQIRYRTNNFAPVLLKQLDAKKLNPENPEIKLLENEQIIADKKLIGDYESYDALWQCTTCAACMTECPIVIEHVPAIVDMRRSLVMTDANFPQELQSAFSSLEVNATPWAFASSQRADWAEGTGIMTAAEDPDFEILFWVGCAGSFDDRAIKISKAFAKLMQIAGINFRILGTEEQCNGDIARRTGNEYLADMLIKANIQTLTNYNVKKIVTICPHCFNTFKNEYPDFGGNFEIIHHTEFLLSLINSGKLKFKKNGHSVKTLTYHDSCYLGRYNNLYDAPRQILNSIPETTLKYPVKTHDKGLCCGAGGGQMFMEEKVGKRVNIERTEELIDTGADTIALNCPFCMTMITDGVKAKEKDEEVEVKDIAEILLEYVEE